MRLNGCVEAHLLSEVHWADIRK